MTREEKIIKVASNQLNKLNKIVERLYTHNKCGKSDFYLFIGDVVDLRNYYAAVIEKDYKRAHKIEINLDTHCRESIPSTVYDFIYDLDF